MCGNGAGQAWLDGEWGVKVWVTQKGWMESIVFVGERRGETNDLTLIVNFIAAGRMNRLLYKNPCFPRFKRHSEVILLNQY